MDRLERPSILEANILYLILGILLWVGGSIVQSREIYSGFLITEYVIILLPNLIYLKLMGFSLKKVLRLNKISFKQIGYIALITIFAYPLMVFFNFIATMVLNYFSDVTANSVPMPDTTWMYFVSLFVIALAPGICEEVMFRGTIMSAYGNLGKNKAIVYSAILFGIFHFNLQNLMGPMVLGVILGITAYKTNSIYAPMLGHTLSNGIALSIGYFASKSGGNMNAQDIPPLEIPNYLQMLILFFVLAIIAAISIFVLIKLIKKLPEGEKIHLDEPIYRKARAIDYAPLLGILTLFLYINIKFFFS